MRGTLSSIEAMVSDLRPEANDTWNEQFPSEADPPASTFLLTAEKFRAVLLLSLLTARSLSTKMTVSSMRRCRSLSSLLLNRQERAHRRPPFPDVASVSRRGFLRPGRQHLNGFNVPDGHDFSLSLFLTFVYTYVEGLRRRPHPKRCLLGSYALVSLNLNPLSTWRSGLSSVPLLIGGRQHLHPPFLFLLLFRVEIASDSLPLFPRTFQGRTPLQNCFTQKLPALRCRLLMTGVFPTNSPLSTVPILLPGAGSSSVMGIEANGWKELFE